MTNSTGVTIAGGPTATSGATGTSGATASAFFYRRQPTRLDRLAQRIDEHVGQLADAGDRLARREQAAGLFQFGRGQLRALTPRLRREKAGRTARPVKLGRALDRHQRHAEGLLNISLRRAALHDELAGEHPKTRHIVLAVRENRQLTVEVNDGVRFAAAGQVGINLHRARRKHRQLNLRHPSSVPRPVPAFNPGPTKLTFRSLFRSSLHHSTSRAGQEV